MKDSPKRSLLKTISYRISSAIITSLIAFLFTREINISLAIGSVDFLIKTLLYYSHERIWTTTKLGNSKKKK
jgi:uncharacterized membrane protein